LNEAHNILILVPDLPNGPASGAGRNENMKELPELKSHYAGMSKGYVIRRKKGDFPFTASEAGEVVRRCKAYEGLVDALKDLLDMTLVVDEATVPKTGIETAPENQVVFNASISHSRIKRAQQALTETKDA